MASLSRNIVANYVGRGWMALISLLLIPVYIKFIGVEAYGLVGFYTALSSVLSVLDLGIGATMNRELARRSAVPEQSDSKRDLVRTLEIVYWGISILAGVIIVLIAPFITDNWIKAQDLDQHTILKAVQLMGISFAFQFPMSLYQGGLMGMQKQVLVNIILIITSTVRSGGVILILWLVSPTVNSFFAWQAAMSLIGSLVFLVAMWSNLPKNHHRPRFRTNIIQDVWKYAAAISANAIIGIVLTQLDKVILSKMLSLKLFAYYSIAATVASSIWMIILPFNNAVFPHLVQLYEKKQTAELRIKFHLFSQVLSFLLLPVCALLISFSKEILYIWIKDPLIVENAYLIVSLLVFGTMLNGLVSIPANSAPAFGWPLLITYTNIVQAIVIIPLIVGMVYWLQGIGAAITWIILNSTYIIFMVPSFFRRFLREEQKKWYLRDLLLPAVVAFAICILSQTISPVMSRPFANFIWFMITGIVAFFLTALTLPHVRTIANTLWNNFFKSKNI
jgi:O-antigen/teichoic acid export membrane protein